MEENQMSAGGEQPQNQSDQSSVQSPKDDNKKPFVSRKGLIIALAIVAVGLLAYYLRGVFIAATVNGSPISRLAVIRELEKSSGKNVLDDMITRKLVDDEAKKKNVVIGEDEIAVEIKSVEEEIQAQGGTLDEVLTSQNLTRDDLKRQIIVKKQLEKILGDKLQVSDEEAQKFIAENEITVPVGQEVAYNEQARAQLKQQKLNTEAMALVESLKKESKINYFVKY